ncbi:aspartyl-phosphate phosphatase Spo0E family protein [Calditerricola satsumensis]|uniref:Aspartyl-phosphate phosphatase Spo0E family protein n=1 Tax=Calditerricola satsumensis TaxID=373054 RepID=A0A8J3BJP3_9BACI|nr:aspartyl-phosphate phosphatase Spo0E family protein [Calditerricola satsumensis]GGK08281.1 hypothetical protein GCM10007043_22950 [Calditerricola satsumensis]
MRAIHQELLAQIEALRSEMVALAMRHGFDHPGVLALSQRIDQLLNQWTRLCQAEESRRAWQAHRFRIREAVACYA